MTTPTFFPEYPPHQSSPGKSLDHRILQCQLGDGYMQTSGDGLNADTTTWDCLWADMDNAAVFLMEAFLRERGGFRPFYWTAPGDVSPLLWHCPKGYKTPNIKPNSRNLSAVFLRWYGAAE
jgi:phage-related protein